MFTVCSFVTINSTDPESLANPPGNTKHTDFSEKLYEVLKNNMNK